MLILTGRTQACALRQLPRAARVAVVRQRPSTYTPTAFSWRPFAGRSSGNSSGRRGGALQQAAQEEVATTVQEPAAESVAEEGAAASSPAESTASSGTSPGTKTGPASRPALFALPLYRKPAFPGFYQVVQVSEQEVLDFLSNLRKNGQGEYIGGFMTKELPENLAEVEEEPSPVPAGNGPVAASQSLRRDSGRINNVSELEEVGTVLQVIN